MKSLDDHFSRHPPEVLAAFLDRLNEEWEQIGFCPYCGIREYACHRLDEHPEMWIGGTNVYGTAFHGWADH